MAESNNYSRKNDRRAEEDYSSMEEASSLAAAMRDSSARRDSSLSSAYRESALASASRESLRIHRHHSSNSNSTQQKSFTPNGSTSLKDTVEPKQSFWSALAKKAKSALLEDGSPIQYPESQVRNGSHVEQARAHIQASIPERQRQTDAPAFQKGIDAITSSLTLIGGSIGNALESSKCRDCGIPGRESGIDNSSLEGLNIVENKASDIISDTRRSMKKTPDPGKAADRQRQCKKAPNVETNQETQLKASRDVAMAMAAKVKLLLRELKTYKADLAFAKERCTQLEEENKVLRESLEKGDRPDEDDLIRLQLETLLAEKSRLAQENASYARENRFLREIVEYHQMTMQDVVHLDEMREVTEIGLDPDSETQIGMLPLEKSISSRSR